MCCCLQSPQLLSPTPTEVIPNAFVLLFWPILWCINLIILITSSVWNVGFSSCLYGAWGLLIYVFHSVTCVEYVLCFWIVICMHLSPLSSMFLLSKIKVVLWSLLQYLLNKFHWEIWFMFTFKAASMSWLKLMLGTAFSFFLFIFLFHK